MEVQNPQVEGFSAYADDQAMLPSPLDTGDPSTAWGPLSEDTSDLSDEWVKAVVGESDVDCSFFGNLDDEVWFQFPSHQDLAGDGHDAASTAITLDNSITLDVHPVEAVDGANDKREPTRRHRLTQDQTAVLDAWLSECISYPYPSEPEKLELAAQTGLSKKQIEHWFSTTRQRKLPKPSPGPPVEQHCVALSAQQSLEVLPAHSAHSEPSRAGNMSDSSSQVDSELGAFPERQFGCFRGSMLNWWLDTLDFETDKSPQKDNQETHPASPYIRMGEKLKNLAAVLQTELEFRLYDIHDSTDRAFLRLVMLLAVGETEKYSVRAFRYLSMAFCSLARPSAFLMDKVLNEIDCMPSMPLALCQMLSDVRQHLRAGVVSFGLWTKTLSAWVVELTSELSLIQFVPSLPPYSSASECSTLPLDRLTTNESNGRLRIRTVDEYARMITNNLNDMHNCVGVDEARKARRSRSDGSDSTTNSSLSACSYASFGRRRGRRWPARIEYGANIEPATGIKQVSFQCGFCSKSFSRKYTWQRHEESVHIPQKVYICSFDHFTGSKRP